MIFDTLSDSEKNEAQFEAETGAKAVYGEKSDKVAYIKPLGDPSRIETTKKEGGDKKNPRFVGHRFQALEPMTIPDIPLRFNKNDLMDVDPAMIDQTREVQAGEYFDLNLFEIGYLFSREEYNAMITGGDIKVQVSFRNPKPEGSSAKVGSDLPTVSLRLADGGSIKDLQPENVLTFEEVKTESGNIRKNRTMLPGFEKFAALAAVRARAEKPAAPKTSANTRNKNAAEFLNLVAAKKRAAAQA